MGYDRAQASIIHACNKERESSTENLKVEPFGLRGLWFLECECFLDCWHFIHDVGDPWVVMGTFGGVLSECLGLSAYLRREKRVQDLAYGTRTTIRWSASPSCVAEGVVEERRIGKLIVLGSAVRVQIM